MVPQVVYLLSLLITAHQAISHRQTSAARRQVLRGPQVIATEEEEASVSECILTERVY